MIEPGCGLGLKTKFFSLVLEGFGLGLECSGPGLVNMVTGQLVAMPTRELNISQTGQLTD